VSTRLFWLFLVLVTAVGAVVRAAGGGVPAAGEPHPEPTVAPARHLIEITPGIYRPGNVPQSVGEPLRAFRDIADEYERLHPGVSVRFRQAPAVAGGGEGDWLRTQLAGGIAPEIVQINTEVVWQDLDKGWWVNLEPYLAQPNPYVPGNEVWWDCFADIALTKAKRGPDGNLYCIPMDIVETGIFYNKDVFASLGLSPPADWEEFIRIQKTLKDAGYIPLVVNGFTVVCDWTQDIIFDQLFYEILDQIDLEKGSRDEEAYLRGYLAPKELCYLIKRGFFGPDNPRYREVWRIIRDWRPYWSHELANTDMDRLFLTQRGAMYWSGSWFIRRMKNDPYLDFDWGIFYVPPITKATSPYACGAESAVIGGAGNQYSVTNRAVLDGELDIVIDFLRFLTTPESAERLVGEAQMFFPNVKGARMDPELAAFADIFRHRYCTVKWLYSLSQEFNDTHRRWIMYFVNGGFGLDEFLALSDSYMQQAADYYIDKHGYDFSEYDRVMAERGLSGGGR